MSQIEDLLQELVTLKKEEMRRTRRYRIMKFVWSTVPLLIFLILSIWGSFALYESISSFMQDNPSLLNIPAFNGVNGF